MKPAKNEKIVLQQLRTTESNTIKIHLQSLAFFAEDIEIIELQNNKYRYLKEAVRFAYMVLQAHQFISANFLLLHNNG